MFRRMRDEHYRRAYRRRRTEEIMGWICVPLLVFVGWTAFQLWEDVNSSRRPAAGPEQFLPSTTTIRRN